MSITRSKILFDLFFSRQFTQLYIEPSIGTKLDLNKLVFLYTLSGCHGFLLSTQVQGLNHILSGIQQAKDIAEKSNIYLPFSPFIFLLATDLIFEERTKYAHFSELFTNIQSEVDAIGVDFTQAYKDDILKYLDIIRTFNVDSYFILKVSRKYLSNASLVEVIKAYYQIFYKRLIIVTDVTLSNPHKQLVTSPIQAISTIDMINKEVKFKDTKYKDIPLIISGQDSIKAKKLAQQCGVCINGITVSQPPSELIKRLELLKTLTNLEPIEDLLHIVRESLDSCKF